MAILPVGISGEAGAYQIERSLRFNSADSAYLSKTFGSAGNRKTWTWSGWVKRSKLADFQSIFGVRANNSAQQVAFIRFTSGDAIQVFSRDSSGTIQYNCTTNEVFRDVGAWYHIQFYLSTPDGTESQRLRLYVNGVQQTFSSASYPSQNLDCSINTSDIHHVGAVALETYFDGYMTECYFIDGSALTPSSFGEFDTDTGVWKPKAYSGSYGTNGFYLDFGDNSSTTALGYDAAGSNDWTPNNFSVTAGAGNDSLVDSPTRYGTDTGVGGEVRGNYCTVNPLDKLSTVTLTNGNLDIATGSGYGGARGTIAVTSGKWYWEVTPTDITGGAAIGIWDTSEALANNVGSTAKSWSYWSNGQKQNNNSNSSYGASYTTNDVIGVALDLDAGTLVFYKNGTSQGTAFSSITGTIAPGFGDTAASSSSTLVCNFGQRPFAFSAPSGYKALVTTNLP
jgi:hypothetical protein